LQEDEQRANDYLLVKSYIDRYHKSYIEFVLSKLILNGVGDYANLYYKKNKTEQEEKQLEELEGSLLKQFSKNLKDDSRYKSIFKQEMIKELLPDFLTDEKEIIISTEEYGENFTLDELNKMKIDPLKAERGHDYYMDNRVVFIEVKDCVGRAIVLGSKPYEVSFKIVGREVSDVMCDCFCAGNCKHVYAVMLQLKETLKVSAENYEDEWDFDYLSIMSKSVFFDHVFSNKTFGRIEIKN
jgi:hypothetical protein